LSKTVRNIGINLKEVIDRFIWGIELLLDLQQFVKTDRFSDAGCSLNAKRQSLL
jgi:hypothetical protein